MPLIALTGGIASGKSTIAARLAERGAHIVDADAIVKELQQPGGAVLNAIVQEFGPEVLAQDGSLNRAALGARVFQDSDARRRLDSLVHPAVRTESAARFAAAFDKGPGAVVVYDVPLLAEARGDEEFDLVLVASAPAETRIQRLVQLRGMAEADARARVAAQATEAERRALADIVIDTGGSVEDTLRQVDDAWASLVTGRVGGRS